MTTVPLYEYQCQHCGQRFEKLVRLSELDRPISCPHCGSEQTTRQLSTFAARTASGSAPTSSCSTGGG